MSSYEKLTPPTNGEKITSTKQFLNIVKKLPDDKWVRVLIQRAGSPQFLPLKISE